MRNDKIFFILLGVCYLAMRCEAVFRLYEEKCSKTNLMKQCKPFANLDCVRGPDGAKRC